MNDQNSNPSADASDNTAMCCANFYEQDIVQELMGGSFHPGGIGLSRQVIESLGLAAGESVLDVACGVGTTTRMMAKDFGLLATGLDFSEINIQKARDAANAPVEPTAAEPCCAPGDPCCTPGDLKALGGSVSANEVSSSNAGTATFVQGSADALGLEEGSFDGVTCECAVSTFADQPAVASEFFRVLKPGGVFVMTDMIVNGELPDDFAEKAAPWTCVAKALSVEGYQQLFEQAGFESVKNEDHSHTLLELATEMKRKLVMAGMGKALGALPSLGMDLRQMRAMLTQSTELVKAETIQYGLLLFKKPV